jgi:hypothetical protein
MSIYLLVCSFNGEDFWLAELSEITSSSMLAIRLSRKVASFSEDSLFVGSLWVLVLMNKV